MIEDLRTTEEAFENHGYDVTLYTVSSYSSGGIYSSAEDPEEALDEYLRQLNKKDRLLDTGIHPESVFNVFLRGSSEDVEQAINEVLQQVQTRISIRDPVDEEMAEKYSDRYEPVVPYIEVNYRPNVHEGVFSFRVGKPGVQRYVDEFQKILEEEGFRIEES